MRASERDLGAGEPVRIAGPVPALVTRADEAADLAEQAADGLEHRLADGRVRVHQRPLAGVERPGLVDQRSRELHLADVVQQRGQLGLLPFARVEPQPVGDGDDEVDDVAAVAAGVLVVGFDHVAEQHRGAAIRGRQLEGVVDAPLSLACEGREEREHRQQEQQRPRVPVGGEGGEQSERCERRVHRERRQHRPELAERRDADDRPAEHEPARVVERELGSDRAGVHRCIPPCRRVHMGEREHERRPDRMPGGGDADREPVDRHAPAHEVRHGAEQERRAHEQRQRARRHEEPHGDEHALGRDGEAAGELELHAGGERVAEHRHAGGERRECARARQGERCERRDDEERGEQAGRVPARERARRARSAERDDRLVGQQPARGRRGGRIHRGRIGTLVRGLDRGPR